MSNPKLALIPSGYKSGKVYSILPNDATGDFDFTRQSIGTRVRKDGLIEEAKTVGSITNLQPRSEEFDNSVWSKVRTSISANQELAPDGTNTADKLTGDGTGTSYIYDGISFTSGKKYTISIFLKPINVTTFVINKFAGGSGTATFNLSTGTVSAPTGTMSNPIIESLSNGWFRCSAEHIPTSTGVQNYGFGLQNYNGDQYYIWGAMISEGALSDYIKTEGTTETKTVETFTDVPRLDWLNSNCPSLLLEPQRTNLQVRSEEFDDLAWTKTRATINSNNTISPNGELTADKLTGDGTGSSYVLDGISLTNGVTYTISIFVKPIISISSFLINVFGGVGTAYFNLVDKTVLSSTGDFTSSKIEDYGNGWLRCSGTLTLSSATGSKNIGYGLIDYDGDQFYLWGAQVEQGSYPTSYIKTQASTVTRLKDECLNGGDSDLFDITEGSWFLDIVPYEITTPSKEITLSDGTNSNRFLLQFQTTNTTVRLVVVSGGSIGVSLFEPITINTRNKILVTFKQNDFKIYINGTLEGTDTSGNIPTGLDTFNFSNVSGSNNFEGKVYDTRVYDKVLTQAEAIELTTL